MATRNPASNVGSNASDLAACSSSPEPVKPLLTKDFDGAQSSKAVLETLYRATSSVFSKDSGLAETQNKWQAGARNYVLNTLRKYTREPSAGIVKSSLPDKIAGDPNPTHWLVWTGNASDKYREDGILPAPGCPETDVGAVQRLIATVYYLCKELDQTIVEDKLMMTEVHCLTKSCESWLKDHKTKLDPVEGPGLIGGELSSA